MRNEVTEPLSRIAPRAGYGVAGLNFREPVPCARLQPGGIRELKVREGQIVDRSACGACTLNQRLELRRFHVGSRHVLARTRNIVEFSGGAIEVELTGFIEQFIGILGVGWGRV